MKQSNLSPLLAGALAGAITGSGGIGNLLAGFSTAPAIKKATTPSHTKITIQIENSTFSQSLNLNCPLNAQTCETIMDILNKSLKKYHKTPKFGLTLKLESCD